MKIEVYMRKLIPVFIILALLLAACAVPGADESTPAAAEETPAATPTPEVMPSPTPEATPTPVPMPPVVMHFPDNLREDIAEYLYPAVPQNYADLTEAEKDTIAELDALFADNRMYEINLEGSGEKEGSVKYDFNGDGLIEILSYSLKVASNIPDDTHFLVVFLGNSSLNCLLGPDPFGQVDSFRALGICDVDKGDGVIDFYVTKVSYNGVFEMTSIYRLNADNEITALAGLDTGIKGVSGDGKVYYWGGNLKEPRTDFNPDYVLTYYDIALREYVETDQIIGKTFTDMGGFLLFAAHADVPTGAPVEMTDDLPGVIRRLEPGEAVTILEVPRDDTAQVRTGDGTEGWVGGFHMVWD